MSKFTNTSAARPSKPYPDFPLFPHATKRWAKKIRGVTRYFGPWDDPEGALKKFCEQRDDLYAGRTPRAPGDADGLCLRELVNRFLNSKRMMVDTGELMARSWRDYDGTCSQVLDVFGKSRLVSDLTPDDFDNLKAELAKGRGPITVGNDVRRARVLFRWAYTQALIERELRFGDAFRTPTKKTVRLERAKKGLRMFEAEQLRTIIDKAPMPMKAMVMIAINGGLGNTDVAGLQVHHLDLDGGWLNFPRPKTGVPRRFPLWPETVKLLREAIASRPAARRDEDKDCVFLTLGGQRVVTIVAEGDNLGKKVDAVSREFGKLLTALKLKRSGLNWYAIRHGFETIAGESKDQVAVDAVMGHADGSISADYRERVDDARLRTVVDVVHRWLFPSKRKGGPATLPFRRTAG